MKKIAIGLVAALVWASPANAQTSQHGDVAEVCQSFGAMAEQILDTRYSGASLSKAMAVVNSVQDAAFRKLVREIVMQAYRQPAYSTYEFQAQAKRDFRNKWELACYEADGDLL
jgi:hypothetical protein